MNAPRILAAPRPNQRKRLAVFATVMAIRGTPEAYEALEAAQPGSTDRRRRNFTGMKFIARPHERGWLAVYVHADADVAFIRLAIEGVMGEQPNPNALAQ